MRERAIALEGVKNCRTLAGMETADGRTIREGMLYRSAALRMPTESDLISLQKEHRLSAVLDLRTPKEQNEHPDLLPQNCRHHSISIFETAKAGVTREESTDRKRKIPKMEDLYRMMIMHPACQANFYQALTTVMTHDFSQGSILFHCTAGKDRCGILTMLVLGSLGVDESLIREDYLLTNKYYGPEHDPYYHVLKSIGSPQEVMEEFKEFLLAKESYYKTALDAIETTAGSISAYIRETIGIPREMIHQFQNTVLE